MQFPDFRSAPQVHTTGGFQNRQNRFERGSSSTSASSSSGSSTSSGSKGHGKSHGQRSNQFHKKVYQTEHQEDELADIPEGEEEDPVEGAALQELASVVDSDF